MKKTKEKTKKLKALIKVMRLNQVLATLLPVVVGSAAALGIEDVFHLDYFLIGLVGAGFIHFTGNMINEYTDYRSGVDIIAHERYKKVGLLKGGVAPAESCGTGVIVNNELSPREVLALAFIFFIIGGGLWLYLAFIRGGLPFFLSVLFFLILGYFYSGPPYPLLYHKIGEVVLNFGVVVPLVIVSYMIQTNEFSWTIVASALPVGFSGVAFLVSHAYIDYEVDILSNKNNLLVAIGKEKGVGLTKSLLFLTYLSLIMSVFIFSATIYLLIFLITIPLAVRTINYLKNGNEIEKTKGEIQARDVYIQASSFAAFIYIISMILLSIGYVVEHSM